MVYNDDLYNFPGDLNLEAYMENFRNISVENKPPVMDVHPVDDCNSISVSFNPDEIEIPNVNILTENYAVTMPETAAIDPVGNGENLSGSQDVSNKQLFACHKSKCSRSYKRLGDLRNHLNSHELKYSCTYDGCSKEYNSKYSLKVHLKDWHCLFKCTDCTFICSSKDLLISHKKCHKIPETKYVCSTCGFIGSIKNKSHHLKTHLKTPESKGAQIECSQCLVQVSKSNLSRHMKLCSEQQKFIR